MLADENYFNMYEERNSSLWKYNWMMFTQPTQTEKKSKHQTKTTIVIHLKAVCRVISLLLWKSYIFGLCSCMCETVLQSWSSFAPAMQNADAGSPLFYKKTRYYRTQSCISWLIYILPVFWNLSLQRNIMWIFL